MSMIMDTPVPTDYTFSWSHSSLKKYEECPLRFWAEKITSQVKEDPHPAAVWGNDVHLAFEDNLKKGTSLPTNMTQYSSYIEPIKDLCGQASQSFYEHKMGLSANYTASTFAKGPGRVIADVIVVNDKTQKAVVIDHKTGKYRGPTQQAVINAKAVFEHFPQIEIVTTRFNYFTVSYVDRDVFYRSTIDHDFKPVEDSINRLRDSASHANFPARRSGLCKSYCPFHACAFNGKYKQRR